MNWGGFFNQSIFQEITKSENGFTSLKPICPTRWTVCTPAIHTVLSPYESVLTALEEMASCSSSDTSTKANDLHGTFLKGNTVLDLVMAEDLMVDLECLNTSLQLRKQTCWRLWTNSKQACRISELRSTLKSCSQKQLLCQQSWTINLFLQSVTPVSLLFISIRMPSFCTEPNFTMPWTQ